MENPRLNNKRRSGQAMLIAALSLGGAILGATAIAGFLTLYQIRTTTDSQNSAKAIFAADAGTEWSLFDYYCSQEGRCPSVTPGSNDYPTTVFSNGASVDTECYDTYSASDATTTCSSDSSAPDPVLSSISTGIANGSERAFYLGVSVATTTYP